MFPTKIPFYISVRVCIQSHCISGWRVTKIDLKSLNVKQQDFDRKNISAPGQKITSPWSPHTFDVARDHFNQSFSVPRCATPHLKHVSRFKRFISTATSCCFFSSLVSCNEWTNHASGFTQNSAENKKKKNLNLFGFFSILKLIQGNRPVTYSENVFLLGAYWTQNLKINLNLGHK